MRDAALKGRVGHTKLTSRQVPMTERDAIRARYAVGGISQQTLAKEYGISQPTISTIIRRKAFHDRYYSEKKCID